VRLTRGRESNHATEWTQRDSSGAIILLDRRRDMRAS